MHPHLTTLYDLQLADNHLRESRQRLASLDWGSAQQKAIVSVRSQATALAAEKASTEKTLRDRERDLSTVEQRIKRSQHRLDAGEIHNLHEMQSTEKELEALRLQQSELEDRALGLMEALEGVPAKAAALYSQEQALLKQYEGVRKLSTLQKEQLEANIVALLKRRETLASELPPTLLKRYEYMKDHGDGVAVVRVVNGACDSCHVAVPASVVKAVFETQELVSCQGCGRYLYTAG